MKRIFFVMALALTVVVLSRPASANGYIYNVDANNVVESSQVRAVLRLLPQGGTWGQDDVLVYDGSQFLEQKGSGAGSVAGSLDISTPPPGTYTEMKATLLGFRIKAKVKVNGIQYYTRQTEIQHGDPTIIPFTTDQTKYGPVTIKYDTNPEVSYIGFPTPLVVDQDPVHITWANYFYDEIQVEAQDDGSGNLDMSQVKWIGPYELFKVLAPEPPARIVSIPFRFNDNGTIKMNNMVMLFNAGGELIGGYCNRPSYKAMNCSFMKSGNAAYNSDGTGSFTMRFNEAGSSGNTDYYEVTGDFKCLSAPDYSYPNSTWSNFSNLTATASGATSFDPNGATLITTGSGAGVCMTP